MLQLLKKFLTPPGELPEIAALREVVQTNRDESRRLLPWGRDVQKNPELMALQSEFSKDPTNLELGQKIIAVDVSLRTEAPARDWLHSVAWPVVERRCVERLRPALKSALEVTIAKLEIELDAARKDEREHAAKYGMQHGDDGPTAKQIDRSIAEVKNKLAHVESATGRQEYNNLMNIVPFILGQ